MILRGTPLIYVHQRQDRMVVYHKGGGAGGQKCRVYDPDTDSIQIRVVETLQTMDGEMLEGTFKNVMAVPWNANVPHELAVEPGTFKKTDSAPPDYIQMARMAHFFNTPREQWGSLWRGNSLDHLPPLPCKMGKSGNYISNGVLKIHKYYSEDNPDLTISLERDDDDDGDRKWFNYVPGETEKKWQLKQIKVLGVLVGKYKRHLEKIKEEPDAD